MITFGELGARLGETDEARSTAKRELADVKGQRERVERLQRDRNAVLESYARMVPGELDDLTGGERHQVYRMLRLRAYVHPDGDLEAEAVLREPVWTPTGTSYREVRSESHYEAPVLCPSGQDHTRCRIQASEKSPYEAD